MQENFCRVIIFKWTVNCAGRRSADNQMNMFTIKYSQRYRICTCTCMILVTTHYTLIWTNWNEARFTHTVEANIRALVSTDVELIDISIQDELSMHILAAWIALVIAVIGDIRPRLPTRKSLIMIESKGKRNPLMTNDTT